MQYAGLGIRIAAGLIDFVILFGISFILAMITGGTSASGGSVGFSLNGLPAVLSFVIQWGYLIGLEGTQGATVGKMVTGIKVIREDGQPLDWNAAILRNVLRIVDAIPYCIPYVTGMILIGTSDKQQRLGDRVAKTVVVRK